MDPISLCRCRVLYLGSAIPLETAVGIEAIQNPCRDRYDNVDEDQKASGIDSTLSVFSSGIMLSYSNDASSNTWFPINSLHVCAAVKAVQSGGPLRFVSLDTAAAQRSSNPPLFACIMRRTKGIKVLECHVFVCKSNQAAMALVQSCTHAFGHKEGWADGEMPSSMAGATRIVSAGGGGGGGGCGGGNVSRGGGGGGGSGFYNDRSDLVQKFDVSCRIDQPKPAPAPAPTPAPAPAQPCIQQVMTPMGPMMIPMNPPGAPLCAPAMPMLQPMQQPMVQPMQQQPMFPQQPQMMNQQYFADWNNCGGQPLMIIPNSPFYPGDDVMKKSKKHHHHQQKKKKTAVPEPKSKQKSKSSKKQDDSGGSDEEETFYVRRSALGPQGPPRPGPGRGRTFIQEVVQQPPAPPAPQPAPPPIVYLPLPQPPAPAPAPERPNEVLIYAPKILEANKRMINYQVDDRDTRLDDFHPDNRRLDNRRDLRFMDGRSDSRQYFNRQDDRQLNYSADQRQLNNRQDYRAFDYRADQRRLDNRVDGRALNYSSVQQPNNGPLYYQQGLDDAQAWDDQMYQMQGDDLARQDQEYMRGFYDAQDQLTSAVNNGQQQYDDGYDDDGYYPEEVVGYYPEEGYYPQPGYTDDDGGAYPVEQYSDGYVVEGDYQRQLPPAVGYQMAVAPVQQGIPISRDRFIQVADGLGYYP